MFPAKLLNLARLTYWFHSPLACALLSFLVDEPTPNKVNCSCSSAHAHESQSSAKTCVKPGGLFKQKDVRGDEGTRCAKVDYCGNSNGTLVSTACIYRDPNNGDGHRDVGTAGDKKHASVSSRR